MYRSTRDSKTNTIINTVAGYLDLSQLYGSTEAIAASLRNARWHPEKFERRTLHCQSLEPGPNSRTRTSLSLGILG